MLTNADWVSRVFRLFLVEHATCKHAGTVQDSNSAYIMKHKSVKGPTLSPSLVNTLNFTPDVTAILYGAHVTATLLSSAINITVIKLRTRSV